jgi:Heterokaryon incompatibility protein (HET)
VTITRNIGMKYLWIDSLCIVQDSEEDWNRESAKMGRIYHDASITIFAEGADSDDGGCFVSHNSREKRLCRSPMFDEIISLFTGRVQSPSYIQGQGRHKLGGSMPSEHLPFESSVIRGMFEGLHLPLHQRGWVLQEQILSFRSLNYDLWEASGGVRVFKAVNVSRKASRERRSRTRIPKWKRVYLTNGQGL